MEHYEKKTLKFVQPSNTERDEEKESQVNGIDEIFMSSQSNGEGALGRVFLLAFEQRTPMNLLKI